MQLSFLTAETRVQLSIGMELILHILPVYIQT